MRRIFACLAALVSLVGCCSGVDPASVAPAAAVSYQAIAPVQRFGVTQEAKSALMIPADVAGCLTNGAAKILVNVTDTIRCLLDTVTPPVVVPVQVAPAAVPAAAPCLPAAPLPKAKECAVNGTCWK